MLPFIISSNANKSNRSGSILEDGDVNDAHIEKGASHDDDVRKALYL